MKKPLEIELENAQGQRTGWVMECGYIPGSFWFAVYDSSDQLRESRGADCNFVQQATAAQSAVKEVDDALRAIEETAASSRERHLAQQEAALLIRAAAIAREKARNASAYAAQMVSNAEDAMPTLEDFMAYTSEYVAWMDPRYEETLLELQEQSQENKITMFVDIARRLCRPDVRNKVRH